MHDIDPAVATALATRRSVRGFLPTPVPMDLVRRILLLASRAPSATNTQPWLVHIVTGGPRDRLCADILAQHEAGEAPEMEYPYYPKEWVEPYLARRREVGWALYGLLGIAKGDREATARQHGRNYSFFGAPVGLIFTIDRRLGQGSWLDLGMFMQGVMTGARGAGLDTCAQAAFAPFHATVRRHLAVPDEHMVACGMALGVADPDEPANALVTPRNEEFVMLHDH